MPKSRRYKLVSLTTVKKKGKERKTKLIDDIRRFVDTYSNIYVLEVKNMRTSIFGKIRSDLKADRFFFGKNKLMALALGRIREDEYKDLLHKISKRLAGQTGLMFTNKSPDEVEKYFARSVTSDYARSGDMATETVELKAGPLEQFPFSIEPQLRKLGLPSLLHKGNVTLTKDHVVCQEGKKLTPEQAKLLKLLDIKMSEFAVVPVCVWSRSDGSEPTFKKLQKRVSKNSAETMEED